MVVYIGLKFVLGTELRWLGFSEQGVGPWLFPASIELSMFVPGVAGVEGSMGCVFVSGIPVEDMREGIEVGWEVATGMPCLGSPGSEPYDVR